MSINSNHFPLEFKADGLSCGIKPDRKKDLALFYSTIPATAGAVFTKNIAKAAPVTVSRERIAAKTPVQAIVVNSGCANACTGISGFKHAQTVCRHVGTLLKINPESVLTASTGTIGTRLPVEKIQTGLNTLTEELLFLKDKQKTVGFANAAQAILTTDTVPKIFSSRFKCGGSYITIWACAKGAGMIHPNMATMLTFILTDAAVERTFLQHALSLAVDETFNCISVDAQTSTNDTVFILANGKAGNRRISHGSGKSERVFSKALYETCLALATKIVKDGEGITKTVTINVVKAKSEETAKRLAEAVASSLLVKTALYGADPNWGRIMSAMGATQLDFDPGKVNIAINDIVVCKQGCAANHSASKVRKTLLKDAATININLGNGSASATYFTCDITPEYVKLNSEYTS